MSRRFATPRESSDYLHEHGGGGFDGSIEIRGITYGPATGLTLVTIGPSEAEAEAALILIMQESVGLHVSMPPEALRNFAQRLLRTADTIDRAATRKAEAALSRAAGKDPR